MSVREVEAPVNGVFPRVTSTCHCTTSSKQEDAEALFMPQLCTLSFISKPPTLPKARTNTSLLFATEGSPLLRDFSENQLYWLCRRLGTTEQRWRISASPSIFVTAFNCNQSRLRDVQTHFSSSVLSFSERYHFFWQIVHTITFAQISQVNFYVVEYLPAF